MDVQMPVVITVDLYWLNIKSVQTDEGDILLPPILRDQAFYAAAAQVTVCGVTDYLSGMALGTDLWCAQIVLDLQKKYPALKLHAYQKCSN